MKYRKKPVVIEAVQWTGKNTREMYDFLTQTEGEVIDIKGDNFYVHFCNGGCQTGNLMIKTLEGDHLANIGDFVIKGVKGEFYPCKPDIFEQTYEPVMDTD